MSRRLNTITNAIRWNVAAWPIMPATLTGWMTPVWWATVWWATAGRGQ